MLNVTGLNEDSTELVNRLANKLGAHKGGNGDV